MVRLQNAVLFGLMPQVMFFVGVSLFESPPLWLFYMVLFFAIFVQQWWYERDNAARVIQSEQAKIKALPPQIVAGAVIGTAIVSPLMLVTAFRVGPTFWQDFMVQVVFVGFVETYDMLVTVRTIPHGELVWPFKFALEHWYVRAAIISGSFGGAVFWFAYTGIFAVLFFGLYDARRHHGEWFGAVTSWSAHVAVNLMLILFPLAIFGFALHPL